MVRIARDMVRRSSWLGRSRETYVMLTKRHTFQVDAVEVEDRLASKSEPNFRCMGIVLITECLPMEFVLECNHVWSLVSKQRSHECMYSYGSICLQRRSSWSVLACVNSARRGLNLSIQSHENLCRFSREMHPGTDNYPWK